MEMRYVVEALYSFGSCLDEYQHVVELSQCEEWIYSRDMVGAKRFLYEIMRMFEEDPGFGWTKRDSGLILFQSALIYACDVPLGAIALLNEFKEAPV